MYGITAAAFNHKGWFPGADDLYNLSGTNWTKEKSWPCSIDVPPEGQVPREIAAQMLDVAGIKANAYGAFRSGRQQVSAYITEFWNTRRLAYDIDKQQLSLYVRKPVLSTTLTQMHSRAGFHHDGLFNDLWAIMVDAVMISILLWIASGFYMWWQQPKLRVSGGLAFAAGLAVFIAFLVCL
jgi:hypothetical protein